MAYLVLASLIIRTPFSLPISIGGGIIFVAIGYLPPSKFPLKIRMVVGALIGTAGTVLLIFGDRQSRYWQLVATGMFIASAGMFEKIRCPAYRYDAELRLFRRYRHGLHLCQ